MTRIGRFFTRFGLAIGIWALTFVVGVIFQGCNTSGEVSGPTPTTSTSTPTAAAPAPAPTATPSLIDPRTRTAFDVKFSDGACFEVRNNGPAGGAPRARGPTS